MPFDVRLENPHIIAEHQMWIGVLGRGPGNQKLNSSFQCRDSEDYKRELGESLVNFARIVPMGMLVFFPSYGVLRTCIQYWQEDVVGATGGKSVWDRLKLYKLPVVEPQNRVEFTEAMSRFYSEIRNPTLQGAIFFAVCRGKVAEGLDFADNHGRAVIITGLPFPPAMDPKVT